MLRFDAVVIDRGGVGADLVSFRCAEVGVEGQGVLVVVAGLGWVVDHMVGVAESGGGASLLAPPARGLCQPTRCMAY